MIAKSVAGLLNKEHDFYSTPSGSEDYAFHCPRAAPGVNGVWSLQDLRAGNVYLNTRF